MGNYPQNKSWLLASLFSFSLQRKSEAAEGRWVFHRKLVCMLWMDCGFCLIESSAGMTHVAGLWGLWGGLGTTQVGLGWYLESFTEGYTATFSFAFVLSSGKRAGREFKIGSFINSSFCGVWQTRMFFQKSWLWYGLWLSERIGNDF